VPFGRIVLLGFSEVVLGTTPSKLFVRNASIVS